MLQLTCTEDFKDFKSHNTSLWRILVRLELKQTFKGIYCKLYCICNLAEKFL